MKINYQLFKTFKFSTLFFPLLFLLNIILVRILQYYLKTQAPLDHFFITRTYYYPKSSVLGKEHHNVFVVLFNAEVRVSVNSIDANCITISANGSHQWKAAQVDTIYLGYRIYQCMLVTYRLTCHTMEHIWDHPNFGVSFRNSAPIMLPVTQADQEHREFVVCPGRMFAAFDQWHLFITAMELHRIHRVSLVVIYVQSVDQRVFQLIKSYEHSGIVKVRVSLRMPSVPTLNYDPNSETIWNNQVVNFQDCLYEFKESAEFLAFPDWDDLLVTPDFRPLPILFTKIASEIPNAAGFIPERFPGFIKSLGEMSQNEKTIYDLWENGLLFNENPLSIDFNSKVVVRPKMVLSIDLHGVGLMNHGNREIKIAAESAFYIHARDFDRSKMTGRLFDIKEMTSNFDKFMKEENIDLLKLPHNESHLNQFNSCLRESFRMLRKSPRTRCFNYNICQFDNILRSQTPCIYANNNWESFTWASKNLRILLMKDSNLVLSEFCDLF